jgi:8-oxo-dGTP pyrophosphatase MutT (NUDIX family)
LGKTNEGNWSDFGGGCKNNKKCKEKGMECLLREVEEEGGSFIKERTIKGLEDNLRTFVYRMISKNNNILYYVILVPVYTFDISEFVPNNEIKSVKWYKQDDIVFLDIHKMHNPIRKFIRNHRCF